MLKDIKIEVNPFEIKMRYDEMSWKLRATGKR